MGVKIKRSVKGSGEKKVKLSLAAKDKRVWQGPAPRRAAKDKRKDKPAQVEKKLPPRPEPDIKIERVNPPLPPEIKQSLRQTQWGLHLYKIRAWLKKKKYVPRIVRKYGIKNFRFEGSPEHSKIYLFNRLIIDNEADRKSIFDSVMKNYGAVVKTMRYLHRSYLGISYEDVRKRHKREERRQLKAERHKPAKRKTFIAVDGPGVIQCDTTFYNGHKWPVHGFVDVFSRFGFYVLTKDKTAEEALWAFKICARAYKQHTNYRIFRVETDAGGEFKKGFATYCKKNKIHLVSKKQPQRLIESLNKTLRAHVERVDYGRKVEFVRILAKFNRQYNNSVHSNLAGQTPLEVLALNHEQLQIEKKRQVGMGQKRVSGRRTILIKVGALVRLYLLSDKGEIGHKGTDPHWSKTIFVVTRRVGSSRGDYRYKIKPLEKKEQLDGLFFGDRLQVIEMPLYKAKRIKGYGRELRDVVSDKIGTPAWGRKPPAPPKPPPNPKHARPKRAPPPKPKAPKPKPKPKAKAPDDIDLDLGSSSEDEDAKQSEPPPTAGQKLPKSAPKEPDVDIDLASDDDETWRGVRVTVWDDEAGLVKGVVLEFYKKKIIVAWGDEPPYTVMWYDVD